MSDKNTGASAFSHRASAFEEYVTEMTMRDYFAAKAMQGICDNGRGLDTRSAIKELAQKSYLIADAMLRAREAK